MSVRRHRIRPSAKPRGTVHPACQASSGCALGAMPLIIKTINSIKCRDSAPRRSPRMHLCPTSTSSGPNLDINPVIPNADVQTASRPQRPSSVPVPRRFRIDDRNPHPTRHGRDHSRPGWSTLLHGRGTAIPEAILEWRWALPAPISGATTSLPAGELVGVPADNPGSGGHAPVAPTCVSKRWASGCRPA